MTSLNLVTEKPTLIQDSELFLFSADSKEALLEAVKKSKENFSDFTIYKLADFAKFNNNKTIFDKKFKAALVAKNPDDLQFLLEKLISQITQENFSEEKIITIDELPIYLTNSSEKPKLAFLFPGQGSQKINSANILINRFSWAKEISDKIEKDLLDKLFCEEEKTKIEELNKSENSQISIILSSLLWFEFLKKLAIKPDIVAGHSSGELLTLYAAEAFTIDELISTAILCGQAMGNTKTIGTMVGLFCNEEKAKKIIANVKDAQIANLNAPDQSVISGSKEAIAEIIKKAKAAAINTYDLPVGNAYHSKLMSGAANYFSENFKTKKFTPTSPIIFSSTNGKKISGEINLREHLSKQITTPVRFIDMTKEIGKESNFAIEVGPGKVLQHLIEKNSDKISCYNVESDVNSFFDCNAALANLYVRNFPLDLSWLYRGRAIAEFEIKEDPKEAIKEDFIEDLKKFAEENNIEIPTIDSDYEKDFNVEPINYRPDYQWSGLLNGYNNNFLQLSEKIEKNSAGTIILLLTDTANKTQLFQNQEKLQINLLSNDQNHFLFEVGNEKNQILIIVKIFSHSQDKKVIAILAKRKEVVQEKIIPDIIATTEEAAPIAEAEEIVILEKQIEKEKIEEIKLIHTANFNSFSDNFCNYHKLMNQVFEEYLYKNNPEFFDNSKAHFFCSESNIKQYEELKPFTKLKAKLYCKKISTEKIELNCEFYAEDVEAKIAAGKQEIILAKPFIGLVAF